MAPQPPPAARSSRDPNWRDAVRGNVLMIGLVSLFTDSSSEMMNPLLPVFIAGLVSVGMAPASRRQPEKLSWVF